MGTWVSDPNSIKRSNIPYRGGVDKSDELGSDTEAKEFGAYTNPLEYRSYALGRAAFPLLNQHHGWCCNVASTSSFGGMRGYAILLWVVSY
jgi:hypothetical protein